MFRAAKVLLRAKRNQTIFAVFSAQPANSLLSSQPEETQDERIGVTRGCSADPATALASFQP